MKKHIRKTLLVLVCLTIVLLFQFAPVYARAGGGSSSGGGSSGRSSSHSHSSSGSRRGSKYVGYIVLPMMTMGIYTLKRYDAILLHRKNKKRLLTLVKENAIWDRKQIQKRVHLVYHKTQQGWTNQDTSLLQEYLTPELYEEWKIKIEWQQYKNERNVLKNIRLLDTYIVYIDSDKEYPYCIVLINGYMSDTIINTKTGMHISRTSKSTFTEYWEFTLIDNQFYLNKIYQTDEINLREWRN